MGLELRVAPTPMKRVARAVESDETRGLMKAVVDADTAKSSAPRTRVEGGEIVAVLQVAIICGLPFVVLRDAPLAHPSIMEFLTTSSRIFAET